MKPSINTGTAFEYWSAQEARERQDPAQIEWDILLGLGAGPLKASDPPRKQLTKAPA